MLVDSHCHLNFSPYDADADKLIADFLSRDYGIINVGSNYPNSVQAVEMCKKYERGLYAAVGLHPNDLIEDIDVDLVFGGETYPFHTKQEDFDYQKYRDLALSSDRVKGLGEVGLDYSYLDKYSESQIESFKIKQAETFREFIRLAEELSLPLIIHGRDAKDDPFGAYEDMLNILRGVIASGHKLTGVVHCYGGSLEQAKGFLDLGFYLGFTGIITFKKKVEALQEIAKATPLDRILVETDAPFLSPEPHRGQRNLPQYVEFVAKKIAELKGLPYDEVAQATTANAQRLFKI